MIKYSGAPTKDLDSALYKAASTFSQSLRKFSFNDNTDNEDCSVLDPFFHKSFGSHAPPPLMWPNLTSLSIDHFFFYDIDPGLDTSINAFMMAVGRVIRYMPSIQNVEVILGAWCPWVGGKPLEWEISFNLALRRGVSGCIPQANLSISLPIFLEDVPSDEVRALWKASLLHVVGSSLEFRVEHKFPPLITFGDDSD